MKPKIFPHWESYHRASEAPQRREWQNPFQGIYKTMRYLRHWDRKKPWNGYVWVNDIKIFDNRRKDL